MWVRIVVTVLAILTCAITETREPIQATQRPGGKIRATIRQVASLDRANYISPSPNGRYLSFVNAATGDLLLRDLKKGTLRLHFSYFSQRDPEDVLARISHELRRPVVVADRRRPRAR